MAIDEDLRAYLVARRRALLQELRGIEDLLGAGQRVSQPPGVRTANGGGAGEPVDGLRANGGGFDELTHRSADD